MRTIEKVEGDQFYTPFSGEVLVKGEEEGGKWIVYLQASNEGRDFDQEVMLCKALKEASDYYLTHGVLSWDHKHKVLHDPGFIVGEPLDVAFTDKNETLVKGFLYKENKVAQNLFDNIMSGARRLGASVGGGILKKAQDAAAGVKGIISKVIWDETAFTHKPVNDSTLGTVSIIPFAEFAKALMAGSGVDASAYTGGRALTPESLQGNMADVTTKVVPYGETRRLFDQLLIGMRNGSIRSYNDAIEYIVNQGYPAEVTSELIKFVSKKLPEISMYMGG